MEDVLDYVRRVFPGRFVHIGGDECPPDRWTSCPKCRKRIEKEGLAGVAGLQPWITRHFVEFLASRGKRAVVWDECLDGDIPKAAVGMNWREQSAGLCYVSSAEAVRRGHDMVIATGSYGYFYFGQGLGDDPFQYGDSGPQVYGGGNLPLEKVYSFNPRADIPRGIPFAHSRRSMQQLERIYVERIRP